MSGFDSLRSIVEFAILREQEAVDFYSQLAEIAEISSVAAEIRKIAAMEERHRDRLRALDVANVSIGASDAVKGIRIADYVVKDQPGPKLIWQETIELAIKREQASGDLYAVLGKMTTDKAAKGLFESLAGEEEGHRAYFQSLYDKDIFTPAEGPG